MTISTATPTYNIPLFGAFGKLFLALKSLIFDLKSPISDHKPSAFSIYILPITPDNRLKDFLHGIT
jgi:hypothetical protein